MPIAGIGHPRGAFMQSGWMFSSVRRHDPGVPAPAAGRWRGPAQTSPRWPESGIPGTGSCRDT